MKLRDYQEGAIEAVFAHWAEGGGNCLVDMATGLGKSVLIAALCRRLLEAYPTLRLLMLAPNRELVAQNAQELLRYWSAAPVGINCSSLGRRDKRSQILFATVNSIYRNPAAIGPRDLIIGDECHLWPKTGDGMYRTLLAGLTAMVPDIRILGTSATLYRLDSGMLHEGENALFEKVVFEYGIKEGVRDGYLSPLVSKATAARIDTSDVHVRGGEYVPKELERASLRNVTEAVAEMVARGQDRRGWLAFCAGIEHARAVRDAVRSHGITCEMVTGETPAAERARIIDAYRKQQIRCLSNVNVLTTGFNAPHVDLLALMRATKSTGLFVQMVGRGTRLAEGKEDCLVLDYARCTAEHGPVDAIDVRTKVKGAGPAPTKDCPQCDEILPIQCRQCPECNHVFPVVEKPKHEARADSEAVIMASITPPKWLDVTEVSYSRHSGRDGKPDSMRVDYMCGLKTYSEWVAFESEKARGLCQKWWRRAGGSMPVPSDVAEALSRDDEIAWPSRIAVRPEGKYWRIMAHEFAAREVAA